VPGALAVHCKAGLGRTGTLVALYLMKHHGFSARQAIGWLRVARPGSVIGEQQRYLCAMEAPMRRAGEDFRRRGGAGVVAAAGPGVEGVREVVERVLRAVEGMFRNAAARHGHRLALARTPAQYGAGGSGGGGSGGGGGEGELGAAQLAEHVSLAAASRCAARSRLVTSLAAAPAVSGAKAD
jgi:hypothetical protein